MMSQLIDIHSHVLLGVDDGAANFGESIEMLRTASEEGITDIIVTPHYKSNRHCVCTKGIRSRIEEIEGKMHNEGINIRLYPGNEIYYFDEIVDSLDEDLVCTLAGSEYVLVEFSPMDPFLYIRDGLYKIADAGYIPILAHAERYESLFKHKNSIKEFIHRGIKIQVNAGSIAGTFGSKIAKNARTLLKEDMIHYIATDAHDTNERAPRLTRCIAYIKKKKGEDTVKKLLQENPTQIIIQENTHGSNETNKR